MSILGIEEAVFGVTDRQKAVRFLDDFGLKRTRSGKFGANYNCVDGTVVKIRDYENTKLPKAIGQKSNIREVIWGVERKSDIKNIADELCRDRSVEYCKDGSIRTVDDMGLGIGFKVSIRKKIKVSETEFNYPGKAVRKDNPATFYERAIPQCISHIVFGVPDIQVVEKFYCGRLGFRVTDRYPNRGVFMRSAPNGNHHNLFVLNIDSRKPKFDHLAFKVNDIHEVIGGGQFLTKKGWKTRVGPGRHYISSACFWYFISPLGGALEYCADEDIMTEKWKPRSFNVGPEIFSEWTFNADSTFRAPAASSKSKR